MMQQAVDLLGRQQGKYPEQPAEQQTTWFVSAEQLSELEKLFVEKIRSASANGSLLGCPGLLQILSFWRLKADEAEVRTWVSQTTQEDENLLQLLERLLQSSSSFSFGDAAAKKHDRPNPEWLRPYLDPDEIAVRVETLAQKDSLTERQRRAVKEFLKEYKFLKSGGNPDSPLGLANLTRDGPGGG